MFIKLGCCQNWCMLLSSEFLAYRKHTRKLHISAINVSKALSRLQTGDSGWSVYHNRSEEKSISPCCTYQMIENLYKAALYIYIYLFIYFSSTSSYPQDVVQEKGRQNNLLYIAHACMGEENETYLATPISQK